jgi:aryl-alcohol dehydrogenase-like predicted oxidoreductase
VEVSALALGGVIGIQLPPSWDYDPGALAEHALDLGITYVDTAPAKRRRSWAVVPQLIRGNP